MCIRDRYHFHAMASEWAALEKADGKKIFVWHLNGMENMPVSYTHLTSGYYQGEFLANYFKDKGKTEIKYLMLQGTLRCV